MRKALLRLGLALASTAAAVLGLELGLRLLDPYGISDTFNSDRYLAEVLESVPEPRLYRHRPHRRIDLRGFSIRTDARGCRGPERAVPKPAGVRRVLFVGDSVTFGWGVDEQETFVALVEGLLASRTGEPWEAVNLGHMGYDTTQEVGAYEEVGRLYEPDLVVLVFVDNDVVPMAQVLARQQADPLDPNTSAKAQGLFRALARINRLRPYLPYTSALATFLYLRSSRAAEAGSAEHAQEVGIDVAQGWELSKAGLATLKRRAAERGAAFCVLDYYAQAPLAEHCAEVGIPYGSIAFTPEEAGAGVRNSAVDGHANARGHRILAANVERELLRLGLVPP